MRPGKIDWNEDGTYTDTLQLLEYNTDFDYFFFLFMNHQGNVVTLYTDQEIIDDEKNEYYSVKWKVGKFYEAGEGDVTYFQEKIVSCDKIGTDFSF